jgi:hypothetical protein
LRDPESRFRPLFRVTVDGGEQVGFYYEIWLRTYRHAFLWKFYVELSDAYTSVYIFWYYPEGIINKAETLIIL